MFSGEVALEFLDIELGIDVFRYLNNAGTVVNLQRLSEIDDKNLITGCLLALLEKDINTVPVRRSRTALSISGHLGS